MGNLEGTKINKIDGGNGRLSATNARIFLMIGAISLVGSTLQANEAVKLIQTKDVEAVGITPAFDANNKVLAHYHVSEFFRNAPEGTLYFLPVAEGATIAQALPTVLQTLKTYPEIKGLGFFGFADQTLTSVFGLVESLQEDLVGEAKKSGILIDSVLLEAGEKGALTFNNYPDFTTKSAENISVIIGQDRDIADLETEYAAHSSIGSALGMLAVRQISENLGSTDIINKPEDRKAEKFYSLTDSATGKFVNVGLSTGEKLSELTDLQIKSLQDKGYILIGSYVGAAGMYFSGSETCTSSTSKYSTIENNSVWNAAARLIREALAPYIKGKVKKDPTTGYIRSTTIAHWQQVAYKACIERLEAENDISGGSIYINPAQSPSKDNPVKLSVTIDSDEISHTFEIDLTVQ